MHRRFGKEALRRGRARLSLLAIGGAGLAALTGLPAGQSAAAASPCPTLGTTPLTPTASSPITPPGGATFTICTARVPSFDGTPIDVDVTIPAAVHPLPGSHRPPLLLFMSGWSDDKTQFESTTLAGSGLTYDWNNAWFANKGWISLTYTPRGWYDSCGKDPSTGYVYTSDPQCSGRESWVHLYDRRWEIHDAQYLSGLLVDANLVNPKQIVATGDSGGGGPSWDLALSRNRIMLTTCTDPTGLSSACYTPWVSPAKHVAMRLAAAVPHFTWTDLVDALASNGRASDGFKTAPPDGNHRSPIGIEKASYTAGLYGLGTTYAQYATPCPPVPAPCPTGDQTADLTSWFGAIQLGEPTYSTNPYAATVLTQLGSAFRSPYYIPIPPPAQQIPIYSIQGTTDPLFNALHTLDMVNRLQRAYPGYPVWAFYGDVGHAYAGNPAQDWADAHNASNPWLMSVLTGTTPTQPRVEVDTTDCMSGQSIQTFSSTTTFGAIATSLLTLKNTSSVATTHAGPVTSASTEGVQSDPIAWSESGHSGCPTMSSSQSDQPPQQANFVYAIPAADVLVGGPVLHVGVTLVGSSAEVAARLWEVTPAGSQTLVSRTVYRLDEPAPGTYSIPLHIELWPNAWQLQCGDTLKLELTQDDFATWRTDNEPATITFAAPTLRLPVVPGPNCGGGTGMPESPLVPGFAASGLIAVSGAAILRRRLARPLR